jgi:hypothetical protein
VIRLQHGAATNAPPLERQHVGPPDSGLSRTALSFNHHRHFVVGGIGANMRRMVTLSLCSGLGLLLVWVIESDRLG